MGNEPLAHIAINDDDVELLIGQRPKRSLARRIVRILVFLGISLAVLHSFRPLHRTMHRTRPGCMFQAQDATFPDHFEHGELIDCFEANSTTTHEFLHEPHPPHDPDIKYISLPDISLTGDSFYFFARNNDRHSSYGDIVLEAGDSDAEDVVVSAVIGYRHFVHTRVCLFKRNDGSLGLGAVASRKHGHHEDDHATPTPYHPHHPHRRNHENNYVKLTIKFPTASPTGPFQVKNLETFLPLYAHTLRSLADNVNFGTISLKSANMPISSESISAQQVNVNTVNAGISGSFNATNSLTIATRNAPIDVQVALTTDLSDTEDFARLQLITDNARIKASIALSATSDAAPGRFNVRTLTSNAPLDVDFDSAPSDSALVFEGRTQNSPARVVAHPSFEGHFEVGTSAWFEAALTTQPGEDPSGRGRRRVVAEQIVTRSSRTGKVYWEGDQKEDVPLGSIRLHTSLSPVHLTV